jgi:hypothetical protein
MRNLLRARSLCTTFCVWYYAAETGNRRNRYFSISHGDNDILFVFFPRGPWTPYRNNYSETTTAAKLEKWLMCHSHVYHYTFGGRQKRPGYITHLSIYFIWVYHDIYAKISIIHYNGANRLCGNSDYFNYKYIIMYIKPNQIQNVHFYIFNS